jgi:hypothetical protein
MYKQDYSNFFTISAALDLPSNSQMEVEADDTLPFMDVLVMKRGPKLTMKVYRKPTHIRRYLHFKSNQPYHVKKGIVHSLLSRVKVIYQDQKDFNNKLRTYDMI